jgi:hypothetical protein
MPPAWSSWRSRCRGQKALTLWGNVAYWVAETGFAVCFVPFAQGGARSRLAALLRESAGSRL